MDKNLLQTYLSDRYQGSRSFLENIIFPIFGEDSFEDGHETEFLNQKDEYRKTSETLGIRSVRQVGKIEVGVEPLYIFDVTVSDRVRMERNRVGIQRLVRSIMGTYSCAFMLFHYENDVRWDWRFTFCHISGDKKTATDSKRYTFLLGPEQSCHTAGQNFMKLYEKHGPIEVKDIENAFNVEALSNEFFGKYKSEYDSFVEYITGKRYVKKGGKYVEAQTHAPHPTLYPAFGSNDKLVRDYVKKLLGRIVFLHFLQKKGWLGVPAGKDWGDGDRSFMLHLFENASEEQKDNFLDEVLEGLFADGLDCDRSDRNDLYDTKVEGFRNCRIPYLNGGLFERDPLDEKTVKFPAEYFDSLLTMLSQYNFTIDENDPDDAEVGIDPEMLGRIFENLLEDNKDKGAFYTPKEIVQYMCRESLIAYLQTGQTEEDRERIRRFVTTHDGEQLDGLKGVLDQKLRDVKICDPAIGSGAFPMGLLRELFLCRAAIEPDVAENAADIKRHIIQNNIYGVDIERGAVDIARLRFWLSLIVDEKSPEALPNLDFKIMQGNSLLEQYKGVELSAVTGRKEEAEKTVTFFGNLVDDSRRQLCEKLDEYYACPEHTQKVELRKQIAEIVKQELVEQGITVDFGDIDLAANSQFFLWHTWFHDVFSRPSKEGFDIVIGNPPYISIQGMPMDMRRLYKSNFSFFFHRYDIFGCFIEHGLKILANTGILTFIQPSVFLNSKSFAFCRKYLVEHCSILRLDVLQDGVFKAIVPTMIMSVSNKRPDKQIVSCADGIKQSRKGIAQTRFATTEANVFNVNLDEFASGFIDKTQTGCVFLGDIARISNGINTGNLSAYIHDEPHKKRVPVVKGASIAKWKYSFQNKYLDKSFDEFVSCGDIETLSHEKLMMKRIGVYPTVCYDNNGMACLHTIHTIRITDKRFSPKYVMALLNTKLIGYIFRLRVPLKGKVFPEFRVFDLNKQIPIKIASRKEQAEIVKYVNEILAHEDEITMLEEKINQCVYSLYGLTENEVEMVEETYRR